MGSVLTIKRFGWKKESSKSSVEEGHQAGITTNYTTREGIRLQKQKRTDLKLCRGERETGEINPNFRGKRRKLAICYIGRE